MQRTWNLGDRKPRISTYSSGQTRELRIRIRWSDALGLELASKFDDVAAAQAVVNRIIAKGRINLEHWREAFFPGRTWETDSYAD